MSRKEHRLSDLVIVESPAKAHTISRYLGKGYKVLSSKGHVRDLPEKRLGVEIERGFKPHFIIKDRKVVRELRAAAERAKRVYLATDNDREGEAIAFDLYEVLDHKKDGGRYHRVVFNEITKPVILKALQNPRGIDLAQVEAQRARRILDRLVGYLISPLLSKSLSGSKYEGLSAGRVQSVALRFVVDREQEIARFVPEEYWKVFAELERGGQSFTAELVKHKGKKVELHSSAEVEVLLEALQGAEFRVTAVREEERKRTPPPPFITSTLQQAASAQLGFSPQKTMQLAQQLYEGVDLPEGREGLITYMRTDSTRVAAEANEELRAFIAREYGEKFLSPRTRTFKTKSKRAQEAHEAIRPTSVNRTPDSVKRFLTRDQYRLYKLIWERFVATQMTDARYLRREVEIVAGDWLFKASGSEPLFPGFLKVLPLQPLKDEGIELPELAEGDRLKLKELLPEQHFTEPPKRYSEATLVKALEEKGIGRPSTYAPIIATIEERGYVVKEKKVLKPTLLGFIAVDFLKKYFPLTVEEEFTARMEESLDKIEAGELSRVEVLEAFYKPLAEQLSRVQQELRDGKHSFRILVNIECDKCGAPMELRFWKGKGYLGCSRYPECKNTRELPDVPFRYEDQRVFFDLEALERAQAEAEAKAKAEEATPAPRCPVCGAPMELRQGKFGRFYGCTRYPECKGTRPYAIGVPCPLCGAELVERYSLKRKRVFYGCERYPECKFIANSRPVKPCPECGKGVLIEKGDELVCSNSACGYTEPKAGAEIGVGEETEAKERAE